MKREIVCFNELSIAPLCEDNTEAKQRIADFIHLLRELRENIGVKKVRHKEYMTSIPLTEDMTLQDYCNRYNHDNKAILLMSMFVHPQVDMDDDVSLESYLDTTTELKQSDGTRIEADGFNAAYCQNTFCVGFLSDDSWKKDFYDITVSSNGKAKDLKWACISLPQIFSIEPAQTSRKAAFDNWLEQISPVNLVPSTLMPENKQIKLRDDHGKDKLYAHAEVLCQGPYVEGILSSLEFQPTAKRYIWNITDDGIVDVVLWRENVKYSMRVKTTGRNTTETKAIAEILKEKYGKR